MKITEGDTGRDSRDKVRQPPPPSMQMLTIKQTYYHEKPECQTEGR